MIRNSNSKSQQKIWFAIMKLSRLSAICLTLYAQNALTQPLYESCNIDEYYSGLDTSNLGSWTRQKIQTLLFSTHRKFLPYTDSDIDDDDVWKALADLDAGDTANSVFLIYSNVSVDSEPKGTADTWNREHLWPKSHGVGTSGPAFTDIHHLRPADWNVNAVRNNLYFGDCSAVTTNETSLDSRSNCRIPADEEAAIDTASNGEIFLPPTVSRGDIARALFYMDVRYYGENDEPDLVLTDCPTKFGNADDSNELAYLSQLLEWHDADPVSSAEKQRNQRACERWQGNRNVFVDYPELVELYFGKPQYPIGFREGQLVYPGCDRISTPTDPPPQNDNPTPAPATLPPVNEVKEACSRILPGDILIIMVNTVNPDTVALVTLVDLPAGLALTLTDNAWTGYGFRTNEGSVSMTLPDEIPAGQVFGYDGEQSSALQMYPWHKSQGMFALATEGDSVILYCTEDDGNINHISAVSLGSNWMQPNHNQDDYGTGRTALPDALLDVGHIALLTNNNNFLYNGPKSGLKQELQQSWSNPQNWKGSNDQFSKPDNFFMQSSAGGSAAEPALCTDLNPGDILIVNVNSVNPDCVAFFPLVPLSRGLKLYLTDNAWTGSKFRSNEGIIELLVNNTVPAGTVIGYREPDSNLNKSFLGQYVWQRVSGQFALSTTGDNVNLYCIEDDASIRHLAAITLGSGWIDPNLDEEAYETKYSALPENLDQYSSRVFSFHNVNYIGPRTGTKEDLHYQWTKVSNWGGSDHIRQEPRQEMFQIIPSVTSMGVTMGVTCGIFYTISVLVCILSIS